LVAGIATAVKARYPQAHLMSAEPEGFDDHARSLRAGRREPHRAESRTICDALMALTPGEITFAVNRQLLSGAVTATDEEVGKAMGFAFRDLKLVVEPGGAVALAALMHGRFDARGKTVVIVLSGGNVDADLYGKIING
jgi:threonine dehydratase